MARRIRLPGFVLDKRIWMPTSWMRRVTHSIRLWPSRISARRSSRSRNRKRTKRQNERPEPSLREVRIFRAKSVLGTKLGSQRFREPVTAEIDVLEAILGHHFEDRELLERALTHKSRVHQKNAEAPSDNEQLEFLGDAVLGFLASEALVARHPNYPEGRLSKMKAHLVSASHLHQVAARFRLGDYLLLGRGEEMSGGREKKALLANALEALLAALYLDAGIEPARDFVVRHIIGEGDPLDEGLEGTDYKSALQEMAQSRKLPQPRYLTVEERGPEHAKTFLVEVRVGREWCSRAEGLSKKSAGQRAAQQILQQLADGDR